MGGINIYSTLKIVQCQEDINLEKEFAVKWIPKKADNLVIAQSYKRLKKYNKAKALSDCGAFLEFRKELLRVSVSELGSDTIPQSPWKLNKAFFCRDLLCPLCMWRKSLKMYSNISAIMDNIGDNFAFVFLTLTCRNCSAKDLSSTIDMLFNSWGRLRHYKRFQRAVRGFIRVLEVEYHDEYNEELQYHPHLHIILAVDKGYFTSDKYVNHSDWVKMWQKAMKVNYEPSVRVNKVYEKAEDKHNKSDRSIKGSVRELGKYAIKSKDYTKINDEKRRDFVIKCLSSCLKGRRLCAFGGVFEDVRKQLMLEDAESGDLIHINDDFRADLDYIIRRYHWGAGAYNLIEEFENVNLDIEVE